MLEGLEKSCGECAAHFAGLCGTECFVADPAGQRIVYSSAAPRFCLSCLSKKCRELHTHLYGCNEAYRWGGRYIYYCPLGLVFAAAAVQGPRGALEGAVIAGPLVMGEASDTIAELPEPAMAGAVAVLPRFSSERTNHLAETLALAASGISGAAGAAPQEAPRDKRPVPDADLRYLLEGEKRLKELMLRGERGSVILLLNEFLGHIYYSADFDLEAVKTRVLELIVILSRAMIDAGGDSRELMTFDSAYIRQIESFDSLEELSAWLTGVMHRFMNCSFDFAEARHSDAVFRMMEFVKTNCSHKLTLDDIAAGAGMSRTYASSLFKEETGEALFSYVGRARVERAKRLLRETRQPLAQVAALCGFGDQSHFTRAFKKSEGISPKKYREKHCAEGAPPTESDEHGQ